MTTMYDTMIQSLIVRQKIILISRLKQNTLGLLILPLALSAVFFKPTIVLAKPPMAVLFESRTTDMKSFAWRQDVLAFSTTPLVTMSGVTFAPVYTVSFGQNQPILLDSRVLHLDHLLKGFSAKEAASVNEQIRSILEGAARLIATNSMGPYSVVDGNYILRTRTVQGSQTPAGVVVADPMSVYFSEGFSRGQVSVLPPVGVDPRMDFPEFSPTAKDLVGKFLKAIYANSIGAYVDTLRLARLEYQMGKKEKVVERGVSVAVRGEFQIGVGKMSVTASLPFVFQLGYNSETRRLTFASYFRKERVGAGGALNVGGSIATKYFERTSALTSESMRSMSGITWNPPSTPIVAAAVDIARGYRAIGFVVGINPFDLLGASVLNSVSDFDQMSAKDALSSASAWMGNVVRKSFDRVSALTRRGYGNPMSCEMALVPVM